MYTPQIAPNLFLGSDAVARNREQLKLEGITHVVNCAAHICCNYFEGELTYRTLWLTDTPGEDITTVLYDSVDFVDNAINNGGRVFVHCSQVRRFDMKRMFLLSASEVTFNRTWCTPALWYTLLCFQEVLRILVEFDQDCLLGINSEKAFQVKLQVNVHHVVNVPTFNYNFSDGIPESDPLPHVYCLTTRDEQTN